MTKTKQVLSFVCKLYLIGYCTFLVFMVYLLAVNKVGPLEPEAGIFRYIFLAAVALTILIVSPISVSDVSNFIIEKPQQNYKLKIQPKLDNSVKELSGYIENNSIENFSFNPLYKNSHGIIYLVLREDGIYKVGKTTNLKNRLIQLQEEYGKEFKPIKAWYVEDTTRYEKFALEITNKCKYVEEGHQELRRFTSTETSLFIMTFDRIVKYGE